MSDWAVGDLAKLVSAEGLPTTPLDRRAPPGRNIWRVEGLVSACGQLGLILEGLPSEHPSKSWNALCFRKIRPDKREACEEEFVTLLKRSKRTVRA